MPETEPQKEPVFTAKKVGKLSDAWLEEWRPYLISDGELLLGPIVSTMLVSIGQLQEGHAINSDALHKCTEAVHAATAAVEELRATQLAQMKAFSERLEELEGR